MDNEQIQNEIVRLYGLEHGRPAIVEKLEHLGVTEWQVRKTIRQLRNGELDVSQNLIDRARERKMKTGVEIIADLRPVQVSVPRNRRVSTTKHVAKTVAFLSDTHGQFVDERALDVACQIVSDLEPDMLVHLGDLGDFYSISSHEKNPERRQDLQHDVEEAARILGKIDQTVSSDTPKILVEGNHENRLKRYIWHTAPALAGLKHLNIPELIGANDLGWEYVKQDKEIFPEFIVKHGDFVAGKSGYTARKEMDRAWLSGISGHTHRLGVHCYTARRHSLYGVRGAVWIENGCLCEQDAEYLKSPGDWQQGFTIVRFTDDGPVPELVYILNGRAFYNGKVYTA